MWTAARWIEANELDERRGHDDASRQRGDMTMDGQTDSLQPSAQTVEPEVLVDSDGQGFTDDDPELATILRVWPTVPKAVRVRLAGIAAATAPQALAGDTWTSASRG